MSGCGSKWCILAKIFPSSELKGTIRSSHVAHLAKLEEHSIRYKAYDWLCIHQIIYVFIIISGYWIHLISPVAYPLNQKPSHKNFVVAFDFWEEVSIDFAPTFAFLGFNQKVGFIYVVERHPLQTPMLSIMSALILFFYPCLDNSDISI